MRLLIVTQKVDSADPILGFFHGWLEEFSKHFEKMTIIALEKGRVRLPQNVTVLSLGKETTKSRFRYLLNFYRYVVRKRSDYDAVLVHMNQEYVLLGALPWKFFGKKIALWRNHYAGSFLTISSIWLSDKVFSTSRHSFTARFKKNVIMPVGVNTIVFSPGEEGRIPNSVLCLSRIAPSKNLHLVVQALTLAREKADFTVSFYGSAAPVDRGYEEKLKSETRRKLPLQVAWKGAVPHSATPRIYRSHAVFVNASPSGMYDKTIFEAMASGCLVLVSSKDMAREIDPRLVFEEGNAKHLASQLDGLLALPPEERVRLGEQLRRFVVEHHSLQKLGRTLARELTT